MADYAQGVFVVAEGASVSLEDAGEGFFSSVAEGGVAESVGNGTGYLHHLQGVREACPEVIAIRGDENLSLMHEPAEGLGVNDAVPVALEDVADTVGRVGPRPSYAVLNSLN